VMVATSGAKLINDPAIAVLVAELFPRAALITPNLDEAALLVGRPLCSPQDMLQAATELLSRGARAVLIKGGHLAGDKVIDVLLQTGGEPLWMEADRIHTANTHGTGCTLSSAIAAHLALGASLAQAVQQAREFVRQALQAGAAVKTGAGSGPLNHGFAPLPMRPRAAGMLGAF
jgi:hydroxymethylpyrimidine/phosphomethylpyrimidine kinase